MTRTWWWGLGIGLAVMIMCEVAGAAVVVVTTSRRPEQRWDQLGAYAAALPQPPAGTRPISVRRQGSADCLPFDIDCGKAKVTVEYRIERATEAEACEIAHQMVVEAFGSPFEYSPVRPCNWARYLPGVADAVWVSATSEPPTVRRGLPSADPADTSTVLRIQFTSGVD